MNDLSRTANQSTSRTTIYQMALDLSEKETKFTKKTPSKFTQEEIKIIEEFYFVMNRSHPDYTHMGRKK